MADPTAGDHRAECVRTHEQALRSVIPGRYVLVLGTLGDKIPSSVTIGMYYELDLAEPHRGHHLLFTSTVNFLSLFGA